MSANSKAIWKRRIVRGIIYLFMIAISLLALFPLYTMFISATHDNYDIVTQINLLPGGQFLGNFRRLVKSADIWRGLLNSCVLTTVTIVVELYFAALAGYAFSKINFRGKKFLFGVVMVSMMLPGQLGIIGYYRQVSALKLLDSYIPLILPAIASCFAIFFFKQYLDESLPNELIEAAYMDGCKEISLYHKIVIPIMVPALVTQGVMSFVGSWNAYLQPLILLRTQSKLTLPVLIASLTDSSGSSADYGARYVGMVITVIPLMILFAFTSRVITEKISIGSAVKG